MWCRMTTRVGALESPDVGGPSRYLGWLPTTCRNFLQRFEKQIHEKLAFLASKMQKFRPYFLKNRIYFTFSSLPWVRNLVPPPRWFQEQKLDTWSLTKPWGKRKSWTPQTNGGGLNYAPTVMKRRLSPDHQVIDFSDFSRQSFLEFLCSNLH